MIAPIFDILSFGAIVVLVVLGLAVIASMMGIFNFAQGEFVLIGAYTTYLVYTAGLPVWLGILIAPFVAALFGALIELSVIRWLYTKPLGAMLATYSIGLILRETVRLLIGGLYLAVPEPLGGAIQVFGENISLWRLVILIVTVIAVVATYLLLVKTSFGLQARAALENPALARASGIRVGRIYTITFSFGAGLAGLAGALIVPVFSLFADLGFRFLIQGFVSIMVGGVGTLTGPLIGGALIGTLNSALPWVLSPVLVDVLVLVIALAFVKLRPGGFTVGRGV
ncbi:MAG: branched-chain amino acid ABC transporter permease [Mesorhizobium sp.]